MPEIRVGWLKSFRNLSELQAKEMGENFVETQAVSAEFKEFTKNQFSRNNIRFRIDYGSGLVDESEWVKALNWSMSREIGGYARSNQFEIVLSNPKDSFIHHLGDRTKLKPGLLVKIDVIKDSEVIPIFTGETEKIEERFDTIRLICRDRARRAIYTKLTTDYYFLNKKFSDPDDPENSLVHQILKLAGYSYDEITADKVPFEVPVFVLKEGETPWAGIVKIAQVTGAVVFFDEEGKFVYRSIMTEGYEDTMLAQDEIDVYDLSILNEQPDVNKVILKGEIKEFLPKQPVFNLTNEIHLPAYSKYPGQAREETTIVGNGLYTLKEEAEEGSISVYINDTEIPSSYWSFDPSTNTINVQEAFGGTFFEGDISEYYSAPMKIYYKAKEEAIELEKVEFETTCIELDNKLTITYYLTTSVQDLRTVQLGAGEDDGSIKVLSLATSLKWVKFRLENLTDSEIVITNISMCGRPLQTAKNVEYEIDWSEGEEEKPLTVESELFVNDIQISKLAQYLAFRNGFDYANQQKISVYSISVRTNFRPWLRPGNLVKISVPAMNIIQSIFEITKISHRITAEKSYTEFEAIAKHLFMPVEEPPNIIIPPYNPPSPEDIRPFNLQLSREGNYIIATWKGKYAVLWEVQVKYPGDTEYTQVAVTMYKSASIKILDPGTYYVRVRGIFEQMYSPWTEKSIALGDGKLCEPPSDLVLETFVRDGLCFVKATWTHSPSIDIRYYIVRWSYDQTNWDEVHTSGNTIEIEVKRNTWVYVRVSAYDMDGYESSYILGSIVSGTSTPEPPSNLQLSSFIRDGKCWIKAMWDASTSLDIDHYTVRWSYSLSETYPDAWNDIDVAGTVVEFEVQRNTTVYVRVVAVNIEGKESSYIESSITSASAGQPEPPSNLQLSTYLRDNQSWIYAHWDPSPSLDINHYLIRWSYDQSTWYTLTAKGTSIEFSVKQGVTVYVRVSVVNIEGLESTYIQGSITSAKDTEHPPEPSSITAYVGVGLIVVTWSKVTVDDFSHYVLERAVSPTSQHPTNYTQIAVLESAFYVDRDVSYDAYYRYRVKAVDKQGNESFYTTMSEGVKPNKVVSIDIDVGVITETHIADNSISSPKIQANAILASHIAAEQIQSEHIEANAILAQHIAANQITANHLTAAIDLGVGKQITVGSLIKIGYQALPDNSDGIFIDEGGKFQIGTSSADNYLIWDGQFLELKGTLKLAANDFGAVGEIDFVDSGWALYDYSYALGSAIRFNHTIINNGSTSFVQYIDAIDALPHFKFSAYNDEGSTFIDIRPLPGSQALIDLMKDDNHAYIKYNGQDLIFEITETTGAEIVFDGAYNLRIPYGDTVFGSGTPGKLKICGDSIYYVDANGNRRKLTGTIA